MVFIVQCVLMKNFIPPEYINITKILLYSYATINTNWMFIMLCYRFNDTRTLITATIRKLLAGIPRYGNNFNKNIQTLKNMQKKSNVAVCGVYLFVCTRARVCVGHNSRNWPFYTPPWWARACRRGISSLAGGGGAPCPSRRTRSGAAAGLGSAGSNTSATGTIISIAN